MEIKTDRLILRPAGPEDLEGTYAYASDPDTCRLMVFLPMADLEEARQSLADAAAEWRKPRPEYYEFTVLLGETQVGGVSLYLLENDPETGELGWILHRDYRRRGIALEAARALMDWGRRKLGLRRFIAQCDSENEASWRLMEKLGMRCVNRNGTRKNRSSDEERREYTYEIVFGD